MVTPEPTRVLPLSRLNLRIQSYFTLGGFLSVKVSRKFEVRNSEPVRRKRVKGSHNRVEFGEFCKTVNRPGASLVRPKGTFPEELRERQQICGPEEKGVGQWGVGK